MSQQDDSNLDFVAGSTQLRSFLITVGKNVLARGQNIPYMAEKTCKFSMIIDIDNCNRLSHSRSVTTAGL